MSDSTKSDRNAGVSRRKVLECMTWAGTGVLWTISGGVPLSLGIIDGALAAQPGKLTFLQISDSHIGFDKPANPVVARSPLNSRRVSEDDHERFHEKRKECR